MSQQGWVCSKCQRSWAPHIAACGPCNQMITYPYPSIGTPTSPPNWNITCGGVAPAAHANWNFSADDLSYAHQDGDTA